MIELMILLLCGTCIGLIVTCADLWQHVRRQRDLLALANRRSRAFEDRLARLEIAQGRREPTRVGL